MNNIQVDQLKTFQICELFYKYQYVDNLPVAQTDKELMHERFENTLKRVVSFFFYKKQGGVMPSYNSLMNRWEKLWFPKEMTAYDIALEQHRSTKTGSMAAYSNLAAATLLKFHNEFIEDDRQPFLIDESFLMPLSKTIRLSGSFDLVLKKGSNHTVIMWFAKQHRWTTENLRFDFAALKLAYEYRVQRPVDIEYGFYDLSSQYNGFYRYDIREDDVTSFVYWANRMAQSNIFVPRRGLTSLCRGCSFDEQCRNFSYRKALQDDQ